MGGRKALFSLQILSMAQRAKEQKVNKSKSTVKILTDQGFLHLEGNDVTFPSIRLAYKYISSILDDGDYTPIRVYRPMIISTERVKRIRRG
mgnify:FL=1